jgi:polypeptide N-acetylgalactosaminyltransferase
MYAVDDMSFDAPLKSPLQQYLDLLPNVRLIRHTKRSGLIVARMIGAREAKSPVIIFLDAHTEVNVGWLEPMLDDLRQNPKQVLQPFIDGIDMKTLAFTSPPIYYRGAFSWDLRYRDHFTTGMA